MGTEQLNSIFKGLKVIDASTVLAGPSVGSFFAELGAEVLKIENAVSPDVTRSWKLPSESESVSAYFASINYKKSYEYLNLKDSNDYATFIDHVKDADVLISNFKYGDEEKLHLTDNELRLHNPTLIRGKITGFGLNSDRVAYDLILQAESGFMSMNGTPESGPVKMPVALIDVLAAHQLKEGLLVALLSRITTNQGSTIAVSLYDAAVSSLVNQASNYLMANHVPRRIGSLHPNIAPYGEIFHTKDGESITFAIGSNLHFEKLCHFLGLDLLITDRKFQENTSRVKNREELFERLQTEIAKWNADKICDAMIQQHVPIGKINSLDKVFQDQNAKDLVRDEIINGQQTKRVTSIAFQWKQ